MPNNKYVVDQGISEIERLKDQGGVLTGLIERVPGPLAGLQGPFIDLGCGAGDYALKMGKEFPEARIIGIDTYQEGIDYANAEATIQGRTNVEFYEGDIFKPEQLPQLFKDNSYELVTSRLLAGVIDGNVDAWEAYASECYRLCRPGGFVMLTEPDFASVPSAEAVHLMNQAEMRVLRRLGKCFSQYEMAVCPQLKSFLASAGFVDIHHYSYSIDFSAGSEAHAPLVRDFLDVTLKLKSLLVQDFGSEVEFERIHQQMIEEYDDPKMCGLWYLTRVTGRKPAS